MFTLWHKQRQAIITPSFRPWRNATAIGCLLFSQIGDLACQKKTKPGVHGASETASKAHESGIPPRLQWQNDHGYCGEASIQSIALSYGAWISQGLIRKAAGGELLLGVNEQKALNALHFTWEAWDSKGQNQPQFQKFMVWLKTHLSKGVPCLMAIYLSGFPHAEYDHIVPAVGVIPARPDTPGYNPQDVLIYHTLFSTQPIHRPFHTLPATRQTCRSGMNTGGNIPEQIDYGIAISGLKDLDGITLPLRLSVEGCAEPNPRLVEKPIGMKGRVTVSKLNLGHRYVLLRFDALANVPTHGNSETFLRSIFSSRIDFQATNTTWGYADPRPILSSGATYYRCIPVPHERKLP